MENINLVLICDYGNGDPAFTEVGLQLMHFAPHLTLFPISTPPFSTVNTGFWIYQIAHTEDLKKHTYIFSNTAPRKEDSKAQKNNSGEKLMYAQLHNGFEIMAIHAGYNFSFIKPYIKEFRFVNVPNEGSQFRSRDIYPHAVAKMIRKDPSFLGESASVDIIPDYPRNVIASIDGYGNIKTTIRLSDLSYTPGQKLTISINDHSHPATFTDGSFNIHQGDLALAPGSSGHENRFMEVFYRGKSASELFSHPKVEDHVHITTT